MFGYLLPGRQRRLERTQLRDVVTHCRKQLRRDHDLLSPEQEWEFRQELQAAQNALTANAADLGQATESLVESYEQSFPSRGLASLRENAEVVLVAFVVAMAVRAFFLQPFKIPTGSMQPTLNGITVRAAKPHETSWWYQIISWPAFGESVVHYRAQSDGVLTAVKGLKVGPLHFGGSRGFFSLLPRDATEFKVGGERFVVPMTEKKFREEVLGGQFMDRAPLLRREKRFRKGEVILSCVIQTGDHLFVDRCTYNFRKPHRGEVFVFETLDLPVSVESRGEFYIKRLGGTPGDTLEIKDPDLHINGEKIREPAGFRNVMSCTDGHRGYTSRVSTKPDVGEDTSLSNPYTLKEQKYFALGDNSHSSSDSREWGPVPYHDIVGRGFFVYWPFTRHFGRVE